MKKQIGTADRAIFSAVILIVNFLIVTPGFCFSKYPGLNFQNRDSSGFGSGNLNTEALSVKPEKFSESTKTMAPEKSVSREIRDQSVKQRIDEKVARLKTFWTRVHAKECAGDFLETEHPITFSRDLKNPEPTPVFDENHVLKFPGKSNNEKYGSEIQTASFAISEPGTEKMELVSGKKTDFKPPEKLPDKLQPLKREITNRFVNSRGSFGTFETRSAFFPERRIISTGIVWKYNRYKYLFGKEDLVSGNQAITSFNAVYGKGKYSVGVSVPYQKWETTRVTGNFPTVGFSGSHDTEINFAYQVWSDPKKESAFSMHLGKRFPSGNYAQPVKNFTRLTKSDQIKGNPANATRGGWNEVGGEFSADLGGKFRGHVNLAVAKDNEDDLEREIMNGLVEYRVNERISGIGEVANITWKSGGVMNTDTDLTVGFALSNKRWQALLGWNIPLQSDWGYGRARGTIFGINTTWG